MLTVGQGAVRRGSVAHGEESASVLTLVTGAALAGLPRVVVALAVIRVAVGYWGCEKKRKEKT